MSEKRFKMDNESDIIEFDYNNNEYIQDFMWADGKSWDRICDRLNELYEENEHLKKESDKIKNILLDKRKDLECDYNRAAKAGMPTGGIIGELDTIEDILEEMGLKND